MFCRQGTCSTPVGYCKNNAPAPGYLISTQTGGSTTVNSCTCVDNSGVSALGSRSGNVTAVYANCPVQCKESASTAPYPVICW
jgi:hypothetical protein